MNEGRITVVIANAEARILIGLERGERADVCDGGGCKCAVDVQRLLAGGVVQRCRHVRERVERLHVRLPMEGGR